MKTKVNAGNEFNHLPVTRQQVAPKAHTILFFSDKLVYRNLDLNFSKLASLSDSKEKGKQTHNIVHEGTTIPLLLAYHCIPVVRYIKKIKEVTIASF